MRCGGWRCALRWPWPHPRRRSVLSPLAVRAPEPAGTAGDAATPACTTPAPTGRLRVDALLHAAADPVGLRRGPVSNQGRRADDRAGRFLRQPDRCAGPADVPRRVLRERAQPDFTAVYPGTCQPTSRTSEGQRTVGVPGAEEGWAGEANLDIEWAYAIAPHRPHRPDRRSRRPRRRACGVPEPVQGDRGRHRSLSGGDRVLAVVGVTGGDVRRRRRGTQTARFDAVYQKGDRQGRHGARLLGRRRHDRAVQAAP